MKSTKNQEVINLRKNKSIVTKATEGIKSLFQAKTHIINHDGTVAENIDSYYQFKSDFNNRSYGF